MTTFYTCVDRYSNDILFRGYKDGQPIRERIQYKPTLYVPGNSNSKFRTLEGRPVDSVNPGTMRDCRQFIDEYKYVDNFKIYGNTNYIHQFISDAFLERGVEFDRDIINVGSGVDYSIKELSSIIGNVVGFEGEVNWDTEKPDGMMKKLLDVSKLENLGWKATTSLENGLKFTYEYYKLEKQ